MRNAYLYKGTSYKGRMMLCGKNCSILYVDDEGYYLEIYLPSHIDSDGNVICFFSEIERR